MHLPRVLLACALLLGCSPAPDGHHDPAAEVTQITRGTLGQRIDGHLTPFLEELLAANDAVSLAIGVATSEGIVYARSFGVQDVRTGEPATLRTVYHLASVSKLFTATAVVQLAERGQLDLDDTVVEHLPYFRLASEGFDRITLRQLLTHTSGVPRNDHPDQENTTESDALERLVRSLATREAGFAPGERYGYSNMGYCVLGDVVAKASGMAFEEYVRRNILTPTGMHDSSFDMPEPMPKHWAWPHEVVTLSRPLDEYPFSRAYGPAATLHSNVLDMCRFIQLNLQRGTIEGREVLRRESHDEVWFAQAETPWGEAIGLGWYLQSYEGHATRLHTGEDPGFESQFILYPEDDLGIVVMANRLESSTPRIANAAAEAAFGLPIKPYTLSARIPFGRVWEEEGFEAAVTRWHELKADDRHRTSEWEMNVVGHSMIRAKRYEDARRAFQFNIDEYPEAPNTYDSYGDALRAEGRLEEALEYYRRALEVDPDFGEPRPKIAEIEAELERD